MDTALTRDVPGDDLARHDRRRPFAVELASPALAMAYHRSITLVGEARASTEAAVTDALDPVGGTLTAPTGVLVGLVTTHRQTLALDGLALGNLVHSLCLAPGEATTVSVVTGKRAVRASAEDTTRQTDAQSDRGEQRRAMEEVQEAAQRELLHGSSRAESAGVSFRAAAIGIGEGVAGAASLATHYDVATQVSRAEGQRSAAMRAGHAVQQAYARAAESARDRHATLVREVSEHEERQASSRVVANYNRMHALNILYFEVVELYSVQTTLTEVDECVFLPMKWVTFTPEVRQRFRGALIAAARSAGMHGVAQALEEEAQTQQKVAPSGPSVADLQAAVTNADQALSAARSNQAVAAATKKTTAAAVEAASKRLDKLRDGFPDVVRNNLGADTPSKLVKVPFDQWPATDQKAATQQVKSAAAAITTAVAELSSAKEAARIAADTSVADAAVPTAEARLKAAQAALTARREREVVETSGIQQVLDRHTEYFSAPVWLALDPSRILAAVRGKSHDGQLLEDLLDPTPLAVFGDRVAFRVRSKKISARLDALRDELDTDAVLNAVIALPTSGVFAESVLSTSIGAELLDDTRRTHWEVPPISPAVAAFSPMSTDIGRTPLLGSTAALEAGGATLAALKDLPMASTLGEIKGLLMANLVRDIPGATVMKDALVRAMEIDSAGAKDTLALVPGLKVPSGAGAATPAKAAPAKPVPAKPAPAKAEEGAEAKAAEGAEATAAEGVEAKAAEGGEAKAVPAKPTPKPADPTPPAT